MGGTTTPPFVPGSASTTPMVSPSPLQEVPSVAARHALENNPEIEIARRKAKYAEGSEHVEPQLEEVKVNYGEHSLIAPTLTKQALEQQKKTPFAFDPSALAGIAAGGGQLSPGGRVGAGTGDMSILNYYNRNQPFQDVAQSSLLQVPLNYRRY